MTLVDVLAKAHNTVAWGTDSQITDYNEIKICQSLYCFRYCWWWCCEEGQACDQGPLHGHTRAQGGPHAVDFSLNITGNALVIRNCRTSGRLETRLLWKLFRKHYNHTGVDEAGYPASWTMELIRKVETASDLFMYCRTPYGTLS